MLTKKLRKEGFSLLLVVLIGFGFLAVLSIAFISSTQAERKQVIYNIEGDKARALAEAAHKAALLTVLSECNSAEVKDGSEAKFFDWFRETRGKKPDAKEFEVKETALKLFPELQEKYDITIDKAKVEIVATGEFEDEHHLDKEEKIEKNGQIRITARATFGQGTFAREKRTVTAGYDFKVALITLPRVVHDDLDKADLNKYTFYVRKGVSLLDNSNHTKPQPTPTMTVVNDGKATGLLHFGNAKLHNTTDSEDIKDNLIIVSGTQDSGTKVSDWYFENWEFQKFQDEKIFYNDPVLSRFEKYDVGGRQLDRNDMKLPFDKIARLFFTSGQFQAFYLKRAELQLNGISYVDAGLTTRTSVGYTGYAMTIANGPVKLERAVHKADIDSCWMIVNHAKKAAEEADRSIGVGSDGVTASLCAPWGKIYPLRPAEGVKVFGNMMAFEIERDGDKELKKNELTMDSAVLFPYTDEKKKLTYSVSISHAPSYIHILRK